ncbi:MAG: hypothetical protein CO096_26105 [Armatimonadetes bacterium CG_4_9_14_3_um_filter_66_14]|nr:MAG: hypothetical protein CO096_26105 [Armatimonadetes bacterium CG_4_9_14_3_um_filter_66_14]
MSNSQSWFKRLTNRPSRSAPAETSWGPPPPTPPRRRGRPEPEATRWAEPVGQVANLSPLAAPHSPTYQPGQVIADLYEVQQLLGHGGMGEVWKVHHRQWGIALAMKEVRPHRVADERALRAFMREAETWIKLPMHPNIVTAYYVREIDGALRLFCEYVEGENLADRLRRVGRLDARTALDIAIQVCDALSHAHRSGLAHRDIKPANVLLGRDGSVKVTDFGLARGVEAEEPVALLGSDPGRRLMQSAFTTRGGTLEYMSPEQSQRMGGANVEVGSASDLWSFAVMLYEMLTGARPQHGGLAVQFLKSHLKEQRRNGRPPRPVVKAVGRCLRLPTWNRPAAAALGTDLRRRYGKVVREPYSRQAPSAVEPGPDELNNQALSLLDLGREEEARRKWAEAVLRDENHLPSLLNLALLAARKGAVPKKLRDKIQAARSQTRNGGYRGAEIPTEPVVCRPGAKERRAVASHEMVTIPPGEFLRGSTDVDKDAQSDEKPQRAVYLDAYAIDVHPVTVAQYRAFCEATKRELPSAPSWGWQENHPVVNVN